ncbi:MAG: hypothetical protein AAGA57_01925 [Planctomycetota bacterium]
MPQSLYWLCALLALPSVAIALIASFLLLSHLPCLRYSGETPYERKRRLADKRKLHREIKSELGKLADQHGAEADEIRRAVRSMQQMHGRVLMGRIAFTTITLVSLGVHWQGLHAARAGTLTPAQTTITWVAALLPMTLVIGWVVLFRKRHRGYREELCRESPADYEEVYGHDPP